MFTITREEEYQDGKRIKLCWVVNHEKRRFGGYSHNNYLFLDSLADLEELKSKIDQVLLPQDKEGK